MPRVFTIHFDRIAHITGELAKLPPADAHRVTRPQAIQALLPAIQALQQRGYSLEQIAAVLSSKGIPVTGQRLGSYMYCARAKSRGPEAPSARALPQAPSLERAPSEPTASPTLRPPHAYLEEEPMGPLPHRPQAGGSRDALDLFGDGFSPESPAPGSPPSRPPTRPSRGRGSRS